MKNYIKNQTSPYLLQHAKNPVNWYPWGEEAFKRAKEEDKPVFLSIGYSTCHWCHVMAHESFEDQEIAELLTLQQMYFGGIFDHIGGGFCRYSTDAYYLVPHFEKMLYDNALLILAYAKAYEVTKEECYLHVAERTAGYILWEMTNAAGGFYSAQDADSECVEGKFYLFTPGEVKNVLGHEAGSLFCRQFDITEKGNFEGKNIPNLLKSKVWKKTGLSHGIEVLYEYRRKRYKLHLDDKILTSWNALMIAALCNLYRVSGNRMYLDAAEKSQRFIEEKLFKDNCLYVSFREGKCSSKGFLDDYAYEIYALLALYAATFKDIYLEKAEMFCEKVILEFWDKEQGGFFLYGKENESLIFCPKETYDGAIFSGNSAMAYNLVRLYLLTGKEKYEKLAKQQLNFLSGEAKEYPTGHAMFLIAFMEYTEMPKKVTIVVKDEKDIAKVPCQLPVDAIVRIEKQPTEEYPLLNDRTTYYICEGHSCKAPSNELSMD